MRGIYEFVIPGFRVSNQVFSGEQLLTAMFDVRRCARSGRILTRNGAGPPCVSRYVWPTGGFAVLCFLNAGF